MSRAEKQLDFDYSTIFEDAFVPIWIENIAPLYKRFSVLRKSGIKDLNAYLKEFPQEICNLAGLIEVLDVNHASMSLYGAESKADLLGVLNKIMCTIDEENFARALVSFWNQDEIFSMETSHQTLDGQNLSTVISAKIPRFGNKNLIIPVTVTDITALRQKQQILTKALEEIKTLKGIIPICASCKSIRDGKGYWNQLEKYISDRTEVMFTHGICPECSERLYPEEKEKKV